MNENKANYAKIGFFVLTGFALILIVIGVAGARVFSKQAFLTETYFVESVTGLDIGSPVKYRGVPVGEVQKIGFVFSDYGDHSPNLLTYDGARQVLVVMALDPAKFGLLQTPHAKVALEQMVKQGLRVKLAPAGVTGLSFLDLDYFNPHQALGREAVPPITWTPKNVYIPSMPSTMQVFKQAMDDVFVKLNGVDIQALGNKLLDTLSLLQDKLHNADIATLSSEATALLSELRESNRKLNTLIASPELAKLPADLGETFGSVRRIAASIDTQLTPLLQSAQTLAERANQLAANVNVVATNSAGPLAQTVTALNQTAQTMNHTAQSQRNALAELIQNLRSASSGLDAIVSELRANPSSLLYGTPPAPLPENAH